MDLDSHDRPRGSDAPGGIVDRQTFADAVSDARFLSQPLIHWAIEESRMTGRAVYDLLVERSPAEEERIYRLLAEFLDVDFEPLTDLTADGALTVSLPSRFALTHLVVPLRSDESGAVVATCRPQTLLQSDEIAVLMGVPVRMVLSPPSRLNRLIQQSYGLGAQTVNELVHEDDEPVEPAIQLISPTSVALSAELDSTQEASVTRFVNQVLFEAVRSRASDIHVEPFERQLRVRFRIDGLLQDVPVPPAVKQLEGAIISRIKVLGDMDIAEKRLSQDGQVRLSVMGRTVDVRMSVLPSIYGESVVLRILDRQTQFRNLGELGMPAVLLEQFRRVMALTQGLVLVTGPTGSGKTTTLYGLLNHVRSPSMKIITIEDPVEYRLEGITQIQVRESIGLSFSNLLRSIVRHDPDVIMVGEIRDGATAGIALNAAITGHLVLATLHTNDAPTAISRLASMGAPRYMVSAALKVVLAQRLVRVICPQCRQEGQPLPDEAVREFPSLAGRTLWRGAGCETCRHTGYSGRIGIFENLSVGPGIGELIASGAGTATLREQARRQGLVPLREGGLQLVLDGVTTFDELYRVTRDVTDEFSQAGAAPVDGK